MPKLEDYRRLVAECLSLARVAKEPRSRQVFLRLAEIWLEMAEQDALAADQQKLQPGQIKSE